jgi:hypothetical protein
LPAADQAGLRGDEPEMGFITQTLGLGDSEKALIDMPWNEGGGGRDNNRGVCGRADFQITSTLSPIPSDQILAATIVTGRPWNRGRIVGMEAKMGVGGHVDRL